MMDEGRKHIARACRFVKGTSLLGDEVENVHPYVCIMSIPAPKVLSSCRFPGLGIECRSCSSSNNFLPTSARRLKLGLWEDALGREGDGEALINSLKLKSAGVPPEPYSTLGLGATSFRSGLSDARVAGGDDGGKVADGSSWAGVTADVDSIREEECKSPPGREPASLPMPEVLKA